jgi:predicted nuclease of predicted toxin-antitoxin system
MHDMQLLLDENISYRLVKRVSTYFPNCIQSFDVLPRKSTDRTIWEYALKNKYCTETFDEDFIELGLLKGYPPKIIWIRSGNCTTLELAKLFIAQQSIMEAFLKSEEDGCLKLHQLTT